MSRRASRCGLSLVVSLAAALSLLASLGAGQALAGSAHWNVVMRAAPTILRPEKPGEMVTVITNMGDERIVASEKDPVLITEKMPEGVKAFEPEPRHPETSVGGPGVGSCEKLPALKCKFVGTVEPYASISVITHIRPSATFSGGESEVRVEGAGVVAQPVVQKISGGEAETPFGVERFELQAEEENGVPSQTAGVHPFALTTTLELNQIAKNSGFGEFPRAPELLKNLSTTLPPGLVGNPLAVPQCTAGEFATVLRGNTNACQPQTAIGVAVVTFNEPGIAHWKVQPVPVFNLEPSDGEPARLGFEFAKVPVTIDTSVLAGNGYAVEADVKNAAQSADVLGTTLSVWGVPTAQSHDNARGWECLAGGELDEHEVPCTPLGSSTRSRT